MTKTSPAPTPAQRLTRRGLLSLGGAAALTSGAKAQPVPGAPLPPGFASTGKSDGSECHFGGVPCDATSETFKGPNSQQMTRLTVKTGDQVNVCETLNGDAYAYSLMSPDARTPIDPGTMERIGRETNQMDPNVTADPAGDSIDRALVEYNRCRPRRGSVPIS